MRAAAPDHARGGRNAGAVHRKAQRPEPPRRRKRGRDIRFLGHVAGAPIKQANYAASKGGVIALTKALAKEVGSRGIRVNCVAPGYISTELTDVLSEDIRDVLLGQTPLGRLGEPEDIARTVRFLLSDDASFITGAILSVDGGLGM
jgi:3-oxoacyl-[acyl-carrier protein] reductase